MAEYQLDDQLKQVYTDPFVTAEHIVIIKNHIIANNLRIPSAIYTDLPAQDQPCLINFEYIIDSGVIRFRQLRANTDTWYFIINGGQIMFLHTTSDCSFGTTHIVDQLNNHK